MKKIVLIMIGCSFFAGSVEPRALVRTPQQHELIVAKRVEDILNDMSMSAGEKRKILIAELENARLVGMQDLVRTISAYLGLAEARVKSCDTLKKSVYVSKEVPDAEPLDGALLEGQPDASVRDMFKYGTDIIKMSGLYVERFELPGSSFITAQREASFAFLMQEAEINSGLREKIEGAIETYKTLEQNRNSLPIFIDMTKKFLAHITQKHGAKSKGITEEISFKLFEMFVVRSGNNEALMSLLSDHLSLYNTYVDETLQIVAEDLSLGNLGAAEIAVLGEKYQLFLMSLVMEQIKFSLKREPLIQELQQSLNAQMSRAVKLLLSEGITLNAQEKQQPMVIASYCSEYVRKHISEVGADVALENKNVAACMTIVEQLSQLTSDYDLVMSEIADKGSLERIKEDFKQLSVTDKAIIKETSSLPLVTFNEIIESKHAVETSQESELQYTNEEIIGESLVSDLSGLDGVDSDQDYYGDVEVPKTKMSPKAVAITVAIGVLIVGGLWEVLGQVAAKKKDAQGFWGFFKKIGKPSSLFSA